LMPHSFAGQEPRTLVCLTSLRTNDPPMPPKLNPKRALFVLTKIDEILAWFTFQSFRPEHDDIGIALTGTSDRYFLTVC
jgi:hypothetical protein